MKLYNSLSIRYSFVFIFAAVFSMNSVQEISAQHDPEFTQYYANPLYLNPAFAGSNICPRVHVNYRNQWPGLSANYVTFSASYDQYVPKLKGGLGIYVMNDRQSVTGAFKSTYVSAMYAYQLKIDKTWSFRFGAEAAYNQWAVDPDQLTFGDQIHPQRGFIYNTAESLINEKQDVFDFTVGGLVFSENMYFGTTVHHISQPKINFIDESKWPMRVNAHFGWKKVLNTNGLVKEDSPYISPNLIYSYQQGFQQANVGMYIYNNPITVGVWYRHVFNYSDAIAVSFGVRSGKYRIGYSYDFTISSLANQASAGAHEVSLALDLKCKKSRSRIRIPVCPKF